MIRFAICDDDIMYMNSIKEIVSETFDKMKNFDEECECVLYNSGQELIENFLKDKIDIFFLDIECGELSGFEIAKQMTLKKKDLGIVYITNHQHYVTEAFVCRPLGFIRKDSIAEDIKMPMLNIIDFLKDKFQTIEFKKGKSEVVARVANIMAINVSAHKLKIFYNQNLNYAIEEYVGQLSTYEDLLMNNNFIKISRESMVNLKYIKNIQKDELIMVNDEKMVISRRRIEEVSREWRNNR